MGAIKDGNVNDVLYEHIEAIADALCGEDATGGGSDRLRHNLKRIADYLEANPPAEGALPAVTADDNGKGLVVVNGKWTVIALDDAIAAVLAAQNDSGTT